jgi:hypothetical protein
MASDTIRLTRTRLNWRTPADVARAIKGSRAVLTGLTLDLKGCVLDGSHLPRSSNDQAEDALPLRLSIPKFTVKNGSLHDIPGGLLCKGQQITLLNLDITAIGEDGISNVMDLSPYLAVRGCTFHGASDKSLQANDGRWLTLVDNNFNGGITGVRIQKKATIHKNSRTKLVKNNRFVNCQTAWNIAGGITVHATGSTYQNVRKRWVDDSGAKHTDTDD